MTKKERLELERVQRKSDIAEKNRGFLQEATGEDLWSRRSDDERKMYPHRRLRSKKHQSPEERSERQWINTPRKSALGGNESLPKHIKRFKKAKKKGKLTGSGHKLLKEMEKQDKRTVPMGGKTKKKPSRPLSPAWVKEKYGDWFGADEKKKKVEKAEDVRDMIDREEQKKPRTETSLNKGKKKKRSRLI